ncbi:type IV secretion system protein VirB6 [Paenibacillus sp. ACRRX]|uniref:type IV secretion system protein VirB6 n=1 Tax=unclassified Paenibacillus TaxID=185978 RepID=UPI001EF400D9|nr:MULTISPECIES: type IV secretion system protein VirB6 [unclassified Paenibacillus]MCG7406672.1 type IV secretion system protein VirB6 [Paenibacillus sp. ACRRX]MDK8179690.1 type IV secretion system protein VirB6 [Paenibacillus sp. UMB4589-SE434]
MRFLPIAPARILFVAAFCLFCTLFQSVPVGAFTQNPQTLPPIQVFDMEQERIVKSVSNEAKYQKSAQQWLQSVTGLSPQITIGKRPGYIVRIPLEKPFTVHLANQQIDTSDVFLIYSPPKQPLLLIFSADRKPYMLEIKADVKPFMEELLTPSQPGANRE